MGNSVDSCCANRDPEKFRKLVRDGCEAFPSDSPIAVNAKRENVSNCAPSKSRILAITPGNNGTSEYFGINESERFSSPKSKRKKDFNDDDSSDDGELPAFDEQVEVAELKIASFERSSSFLNDGDSPEAPSSGTSAPAQNFVADESVPLRNALKGVAHLHPEESDDEKDESLQFSPALTAQGSIMKADACFKQQLYINAKMHLKCAIDYALDGAKNKHNALMLARAYGNLASVYEFLHLSSKAVPHHVACINLMRELGDTHREYTALQNAKVTFVKLKMFKRAYVLAQRSVAIAQTKADRAESEAWLQRLRKWAQDQSGGRDQTSSLK